MSHSNRLSDRSQQILRATVRHYISTAEPVGSKTLAQEYDFSVSSATIRNAMGRLEKAGLLYQPHTSAGRIPSDSGYRLYVDRLMTPDETWGRQIEKVYSKQLNLGACSFEVLLRRAAQILATLSGQIALITSPQGTANVLRHLQLLQVNATQVMLIIVTDSYQTQSVLVELPPSLEATSDRDLAEGELQILSNFLNHQLRGRSLWDLANLDWGELDREFKCYADFLQILLGQIASYSQLPSSTPIMIQGISEVLRQPEFSQLQQVQMLLHLLEDEQEQLLPLMFALPEFEGDNKRVSVRIGSENPLEPLSTCTLISANYYQGETPVGSIGVLGPTRMLYENAIAMVKAAADYLSEALG